MHYDLNYIKGNREALTNSIRRRFLNPPIKDPVERLIELNESIKNLRKEVDTLRHERNVISLEFSKKKGSSDKTFLRVENEERKHVRDIMEKTNIKEREIALKEGEAEKLFLWLPNITSEDAPDGKDDTENVELRKVGHLKKHDFEIQDHILLCEKRGLVDIESAAKVAGSRFYYLKGKLVQLALALEMYSIVNLASKGYTPLMPPLMLKREVYGGIAHLATFEDALYRVTGAEDTGKEDRFLISTTEHPLIAMYANTSIPEKELPIKMVGVSLAFRREAGAHGKDQKGIFRVHQFNQTEQIIFCKPEDAAGLHEEMLDNAEEMWKELDIPYRVVNVCAGDMGVRDVKQYDIEAYLYAQKAYREVGSFDNTTDWIARRLNIKYVKDGGDRAYVNTLDGTGLPIQRTLIAIIENYQQRDGTIKVPEALVKYTGFKEI